MPKPKLTRIQASDLPQDMQVAHAASMRLRGDATFFEVFGNHPGLYRWYTGSFYAEVFRAGLVDRRIKELVRLRLSTLHGCRFCNQGNRVDALRAGLSTADIEHIGDADNQHFVGRERAALLLADQVALTNPDGELDDHTYQELKVYYDDAEILELGMVMGVLCGMAKFMFAFDLVEKEATCPFCNTD